MTIEERMSQLEQRVEAIERECELEKLSSDSREFVLVDSDRRPRAFLSTTGKEYPSLVFLDENGMPRMMLEPFGITFVDETGKTGLSRELT